MNRAFFLTAILLSAAVRLPAADSGFNGRWNLLLDHDSRGRAWWLEVDGAGTPNLHGRFVGGPGGGMDPTTGMSIHNGELVFSLERLQGVPGSPGKETKGIYHARIVDGQLRGSLTLEGTTVPPVHFTGMRAPGIDERDDASWKRGKPQSLFNGAGLKGWHLIRPSEKGWYVEGGILKNQLGARDLVSDATFWNFALHVEFRIGEHSNSGIALRGRYEVQILDDYGKPPEVHGNGALYSRVTPSVNASRKPGEWQTYDIRLVGRTLTVRLNGTTILDHVHVDGPTAMVVDPYEGKPGPLVLQGDHGPVEFRAVVLTPLTKN